MPLYQAEAMWICFGGGRRSNGYPSAIKIAADGFRSSWRKACAKAGVKDLTFHDLRGSAITRLAVAGATVPEIAKFSGLSLADVRSILDRHYLGGDEVLAENAVRKLEREQNSKTDSKRPKKVLPMERKKLSKINWLGN